MFDKMEKESDKKSFIRKSWNEFNCLEKVLTGVTLLSAVSSFALIYVDERASAISLGVGAASALVMGIYGGLRRGVLYF